jgi:hypothetical protein
VKPSTGPASAIDLALTDLHPLLAPLADDSFPPGMPAHVTLLYPWRTPVTTADLDAAAAVVAGFGPCSFTLGSAAVFPDPLVYLPVEPDTGVRALMHALAAAFPDTPPYGGTIPDPTPHVTVRRCADHDDAKRWIGRIDEILAPLRPLEVRVDVVTVHARGDDGRWRPEAQFPLGS